MLHKTIDDLLLHSELGDQLEIIAVLDGYWPEKPIKHDPRVKVVHLGGNRGMRGAINAGVSVSKGEFFMRLDEHCSFGQGYDRIMTEACEPNQIMTAKRFFLDPIKWEVMDLEPVGYEKLIINRISETARKFTGKPWKERDKKRNYIMIDETEALQGSMWIMPRKWWDDVIGELQTEGYGPLIQDSVEVCMKTWQAGGKLMLNKNTFFAHKHRSFNRTHNNGTIENPARCEDGYKYALDQWENYYSNFLRPKWDKKYASE
jgi:GT2 family glycosyltransferase